MNTHELANALLQNRGKDEVIANLITTHKPSESHSYDAAIRVFNLTPSNVKKHREAAEYLLEHNGLASDFNCIMRASLLSNAIKEADATEDEDDGSFGFQKI